VTDTPSAASERFAASLASGGSKEVITYDLSAFQGLEYYELGTAIGQLLDLAGGGDARAMETLGHAPPSRYDQDSPDGAELIEQIRAFVGGEPGPMRSAARRALVRLDPSDENIKSLQQDMEEYPAMVSSVFSTVLLKEVGGALEAQLAALHHPDDLTRQAAAEGLIQHFNLQEYDHVYFEDAQVYFSRLVALQLLLYVQLPTAIEEAANGLTEIFRALEGGADPKDLNLIYRPDDYDSTWKSILEAITARKNPPPYPVDEIQALEGGAAYFIRAAMFEELNVHRDPRAIEGIVATKPEGWRTILEEEEKLATARESQAISTEDELIEKYKRRGLKPPPPWLKLLRAAIADLD